ncbi:MAG: DUF6602 domain-containing protein [Anaerolineales bacterium]
MDVNQIFDGIGQKMLNEFDHISSQLPQAAAVGADREDALSKFLAEFLPTKFAVSRGFVMDHEGTVSSECDIVVYDPASCPLLYVEERNRVFPCEAVAATIEVKSRLSSANLEDAMGKIRRIKSMRRQAGPLAGVIFAYRSQWSKDPITSLADRIQVLHTGVDPSQFMDLVCVLDSGLVELTELEGEASLMAYVELKKPVLFMFFVRLLDILESAHPSSPNYSMYSQGIEIGTVRLTPAQPDSDA